MIHEAGVRAEGRGGQGLLGLEDVRTHVQPQLHQSLLCYSGLISRLWSLGFSHLENGNNDTYVIGLCLLQEAPPVRGVAQRLVRVCTPLNTNPIG